jgi:hypothetical protein
MLWKHNTSIVAPVFGDDGILLIRYVDPREGLSRIGIHPGTLLLRSRAVGEKDYILHATAYSFKADCKPLPYAVIGQINEQSTKMVFVGAAPVRKQNGCDLDHLDREVPGAHLLFTALTFE